MARHDDTSSSNSATPPRTTANTDADATPTDALPTEALPADAEKDPDEWVTGDERMTGPQASYLRTLAHEAGEPMDDGLSKAEASKRIDELQAKTGRGRDH